MKKFIKYNLIFIVAFFMFCIFSASVNAYYKVAVKDGCLYIEVDGSNTKGDKYYQKMMLITSDELETAKSNYYFYRHKEGNNEVLFSRNYMTGGDEYFELDPHRTATVTSDGKDYICNKEEKDVNRCFAISKGLIYSEDGKLIEDNKEPVQNYGRYKEKTSNQCAETISLYDVEEKPEQEKPSGCNFYSNDSLGCKNNPYFSCVWVKTENGGYCNTDNLQYLKCGDAFDLPSKLPSITSFFINFLKIITPIVLIVVSIISLVKAIMASKEDEMKKATQGLKRRIIAAAMVFFVISIVQFVILKVADSSETGSIGDCLSCFINNDCDGSAYFKTNENGRYECHYLDNIDNGVSCPEDEK